MAGKTGISGLDKLRKQMDDAKKNVVKDVLEKNERFVEENSNARRQAAFDRYQIGLLEKENANLMQKITCSTPEEIEALVNHRVNQAVKRKLSHVGAVIQRTVNALNSCMEQLNSIASDVQLKAKELERKEVSELNRISEIRGKPVKVLMEKKARKDAVTCMPSVLESPMYRETEDDDVGLGGDCKVPDVASILEVVPAAIGKCVASVLTKTSPDQEISTVDEDFLSTTITFRQKARTKRRQVPESSWTLASVEGAMAPSTTKRAKNSSTPPIESVKSVESNVTSTSAPPEHSGKGGAPEKITEKRPSKSITPPERNEDHRAARERSATPIEGGRRKRNAAAKIGSFKEPSLITKMRRSK